MRRFSSRTLTQATRNACKFWLYLPSRIEAPLQLWGRNNRNYLELQDVREDIVRACELRHGDGDAQCTLQLSCRRVILQSITLERLHLLDQLPLPPSLRNYLATPHFTQDYDLEMPGPAPTDENITFFIRHFHYHPNHLARLIHVFPTTSNINDANIIVKIHHVEDCRTCHSHIISNSAIEALKCFKTIRHRNIQTFYGMFQSPETHSIFFSLERTRAAFFYILVNLAAEETEHLPENILCGFFTQMISALTYINKHHSLFVPVTCRSFLIDYNGCLKLENPLGMSHRNFTVSPLHILSRAQYKEFYVTWSLGCVLYNMATLLTLDEEHHNIPRIEHEKVHTKCPSERCDCFSANYQQTYSKDFVDLVLTCLNPQVEDAVTLDGLAVLVEKYKETLAQSHSDEITSWLSHYFMSH